MENMDRDWLVFGGNLDSVLVKASTSRIGSFTPNDEP
jgi:hypothetical protein